MGSSKLLASVFFWCSFWCDDLPQLQRSVTPSGALTPSEGCCFLYSLQLLGSAWISIAFSSQLQVHFCHWCTVNHFEYLERPTSVFCWKKPPEIYFSNTHTPLSCAHDLFSKLVSSIWILDLVDLAVRCLPLLRWFRSCCKFQPCRRLLGRDHWDWIRPVA